MATSSVNFIAALGTGSGVDIKALAQNLVDAEKAPRQELIQKRIDKNEQRASGYRTVNYGIEQLKAALDQLKTSQAFSTVKAESSNASAIAVTASGAAAAGSYAMSVTSLAQGQRSTSATVPSMLNGGANFQIYLAVGGGAETEINVTTPTPQGAVDAINRAGTGVTASLVNVGGTPADYRIVLTGAVGATNAFTVRDNSVDGLGFAARPDVPAASRVGPQDRAASNAVFKIDGLEITRTSNRITDVIDGVTLDLKTTVSDASPAQITLQRDTASVKDKIKAVVTAYNDLQSILDAGFDPDSEVEGLGGTLVGDTTARRVRDQVRRIMMPQQSTAPGASLDGLRSLGIFIDTDNRMKFATLGDGNPNTDTLFKIGDEGTLDALLKDRFEDVAELFSPVNGLGKDLGDQLVGNGRYVDRLAAPSSPGRILLASAASAQQLITSDKDRLTALEERMKGLLERYTRQFSIMDSLVGEAKSTRTGVENSFKGMSYSRN